MYETATPGVRGTGPGIGDGVRGTGPGITTGSAQARAHAIELLQAKRAFRGSVVVYVLVNALLVGVWATTGAGAFWPAWPMLGWGIGLGVKGWHVRGAGRPVDEAAILREITRSALR